MWNKYQSNVIYLCRLYVYTTSQGFFFSRNVVWGGGGGNIFYGERNCEKHPKNKQNLLVFGGGG